MSSFPTLNLYFENPDTDFLMFPFPTFPINVVDAIGTVRRITARVGMTRYGQRMADDCEMTVVVDGNDAFWKMPLTHWYLDKPTYCVLMVGGMGGNPLFVGHLLSYRTSGSGEGVLVIAGRFSHANTMVSIPTGVNVGTDVVIRQALEAANVVRRQADDFGKPYWVLDDPVAGILDSVVLPGSGYLAGVVGFQAGKTVFPFVADQFQGLMLRQIIEACVNAEVGYFYEDTLGALQFKNRHAAITQYTPFATFTPSDVVDVGFQWGGHLVNEIVFRVQPRRVVSNSVVWQSTTTMKVLPGTNFFNIRLIDTNGRVVAIQDSLSALSWSFLGAVTGAVIRCNVLVTANGGVAEVQVFNPSSEVAILQVGARLKATALVVDPAIDVIERDNFSVAYWGRRTASYELALFDQPEAAISTAKFMLALMAQPTGIVEWFEIQNDTSALLAIQMGQMLFKIVRLTFPDLAVDENYLVVGVVQNIDMGAMKIVTRYYVERQQAGHFWQLDRVGYAELGTATRLAY